MSEHLLIGLASIIVLGIMAQWLAWRLHLPAILLLLVFGIIAGPIAGVVNPDELFGKLLFPLVSISVAIILFEGGSSLRIGELRRGGRVVRNLTTVGLAVTWVLSAAAAYFIVGIQLQLAVLLGAILVVSGPTVIIPLLRHVRPRGSVGSIVRWEGIVNDPIGAILAVLVLQAIISGGMGAGIAVMVPGILKAAVAGALMGLLGAVAVIVLLKRYLVPDFLQNPVSLMIVVTCYAASNAVQTESGLLAVTAMGVVLANQKWVSIRHIVEFKENLRVLLISSLFVILAARLTTEQLSMFGMANWLFVGSLILVVRPAMVFASTWRSGIKPNERLFLAWMAPRGIVAAAVASVFAIHLADTGFADSTILVPLTFQVIIGTVAVYGFTALPVARRLGVAQARPQGVLFAGAQTWVRSIARILKEEKLEVALVDSNWANVAAARSEGLRAYYANVLSEDLLSEIQLDGIGRLLAMTPNDEVNALATLHFEDIFGRSEVYQLPRFSKSSAEDRAMPLHLRGRFLFDERATYDYLASRFRAGAVVKRNRMTDEFDFEAFRTKYGEDAIPLFIITQSGDLKVQTAAEPVSPKEGQTLISIVDEVEDEAQSGHPNGRMETR